MVERWSNVYGISIIHHHSITPLPQHSISYSSPNALVDEAELFHFEWIEHVPSVKHDRMRHRLANLFQINPLGTQIDGLIVEEQSSQEGTDFDAGWDGVWTSEARITHDGWTATIEIPFSTLNFTQSKQVLWGLNFKRFIRRKNEQDLWSAYWRRFGITKVSQAGDLSGITDIGSGRLFIVKPYGLATYDKLSGQNPKFPLTGGVDVKYGLSSNLLLNLTGNTDFADTDVDLEPFNITPFKVFIPEKRQFLWPPPFENREVASRSSVLTEGQAADLHNGYGGWISLRARVLYNGHRTDLCIEWQVIAGTPQSGAGETIPPSVSDGALCHDPSSNYAD